jgi:hypothetical protein
MSFSKKYFSRMLIILVSMAVTGLMPVQAFGNATCTSGVADPPFLAAGVDPNLLLMIDNSGSMLDLAYVETDSECFDDTYDPTATYAGYFQPTILYVYNLTLEKFEVWNSSTDDQWYNATGNLYYRSPLAAAVWIKIDATPNVTGFVAYGNFLNWAAASKIDVQKEILTGGKHDATNNLLVMESRGCSNRRYLKKIQFDRYQDTGGNVVIEDNYLTLAVRSPISPTFDAWENNTALILWVILLMMWVNCISQPPPARPTAPVPATIPVSPGRLTRVPSGPTGLLTLQAVSSAIPAKTIRLMKAHYITPLPAAPPAEPVLTTTRE